MSDIGAEQNHLWPVSMYSPPGPPPSSGSARVVWRARLSPRLGPGERTERAELNRAARDLVVGGVVADLVHAVAVTVVRVKFRRVTVRLLGPRPVLVGADETAGLVQPIERPTRIVPLDPLHQRQIVGELVELNPRRDLILHVVRDDSPALFQHAGHLIPLDTGGTRI